MKNEQVGQHATLLPLRPVDFLILLILLDSDRHGYGIVKELSRRTEGTVELLPGNLYAVLRRLMKDGLIVESSRPSQDVSERRRRYYGITSFGKQVAAAEAERMRSLVHAAEASELIEETVR